MVVQNGKSEKKRTKKKLEFSYLWSNQPLYITNLYILFITTYQLLLSIHLGIPFLGQRLGYEEFNAIKW
jgi:hypothetical protein